MAQSPPLLIAEILTSILECLEHHGPSITAALRVNKLWFSCGTDVLWRRAGLDALALLPEDRRQLYASKMTSLCFNGDEESSYHGRFRHVRFTSLKHVSLDAYRPAEGSPPLRQYLQPPLESFCFYGGTLTDDMLAQLQTTCWRLRELLVDSPGTQITPSSFLGCVSACKHLEHLRVLHGMNHLVTDELVMHLAQRPNLVGFHTNKEWTVDLMRRITAEVSRPFPALRNLRVSVFSLAVLPLTGLAPGLVTLELNVVDSRMDIIHSLASLTELQNLALSFAAPKSLSRSEFLALKELSKLQALSIGPADGDETGQVTASASGFSNSDFHDLVSSLPRMRRLSLMVQCDISVAVIMSLSKHCPFLEELSLPQVLDLPALQTPTGNGVILARLRALDLGGLRPAGEQGDRPPPDQLISSIKTWFPKLHEFYCSHDDDFSDAVTGAFVLGHAQES